MSGLVEEHRTLGDIGPQFVLDLADFLLPQATLPIDQLLMPEQSTPCLLPIYI
jgi:hypothetical protein